MGWDNRDLLSRSNEPSGHVGMSVWRLPRGQIPRSCGGFDFNLSSKDGGNKVQEKLQDYMRHTVSENESASFPKLVNRVHFLKSETKGMGQMCEIFDQVRQDGIEFGRQEMKIIFIDKLIHSLGITKERACEIMDLDVSEYECALSGQMSACSGDLRV